MRSVKANRALLRGRDTLWDRVPKPISRWTEAEKQNPLSMETGASNRRQLRQDHLLVRQQLIISIILTLVVLCGLCASTEYLIRLIADSTG